MRKQTKLVAVLSAAALLAIGASMTSFAAQGWTQEDGQWVYYNNSGDMVYDEWKKSGNNYFYLGSEGYMLTNSLIEDGENYYYVDANGAMIKNQWVQIEADDMEMEDVEYRWYYFGATGRAYRNAGGFATKTINGKKYAFDEYGKMLFGFVDADGYMVNTSENPILSAERYFGSNEDGAMYTGWMNYTDGLDNYLDEDRDSLWFYFNPTNGRKVKEAEKKKIGKYYYSFDAEGVMNTGWNATDSVATNSRYFSGDDQGWMQKNSWVWAVPSDDMDKAAEVQPSNDHEDGTSRWFYVNASGNITADRVKKINSKWYAFDEIGRMKTGLVVLKNKTITENNTENTYGIAINAEETEISEILNLTTADGYLYYFGNDEERDGAMKTGSNIRIEMLDDTYTFGFAKTGAAMQGVVSNKLYVNGVLQTAGDMKYAVKHNPNGDLTKQNEFYVVGTSGTVVKNGGTVRDADDNYYAVGGDKTDSKGKIAMFSADDEYASRKAAAFAKSGTEGKYTGEKKDTSLTAGDYEIIDSVDKL